VVDQNFGEHVTSNRYLCLYINISITILFTMAGKVGRLNLSPGTEIKVCIGLFGFQLLSFSGAARVQTLEAQLVRDLRTLPFHSHFLIFPSFPSHFLPAAKRFSNSVRRRGRAL